MDYRGLFILLYFNCVYSLRWTTASPENSNADFEASESDLTYNGIPLVTPYQEPDVCKLDEDGQPPRPRIILLGATGVGKSTIGNRLFQGPYDSHLPEPPIVMVTKWYLVHTHLYSCFRKIPILRRPRMAYLVLEMTL